MNQRQKLYLLQFHRVGLLLSLLKKYEQSKLRYLKTKQKAAPNHAEVKNAGSPKDFFIVKKIKYAKKNWMKRGEPLKKRINPFAG